MRFLRVGGQKCRAKNVVGCRDYAGSIPFVEWSRLVKFWAKMAHFSAKYGHFLKRSVLEMFARMEGVEEVAFSKTGQVILKNDGRSHKFM